jgi:hypothetical protein
MLILPLGMSIPHMASQFINLACHVTNWTCQFTNLNGFAFVDAVASGLHAVTSGFHGGEGERGGGGGAGGAGNVEDVVADMGRVPVRNEIKTK